MKRTQYAWVVFAVIVIISALIISQNHELKTILILSALAIVLLLLFFRLTISVNHKEVKFSMGIGIINGKYKLSDITYCKPLSYVPFGWGIRLRPGVILFNVSSNKAVELAINGKTRKVWIGTNTPEEIAEYINDMRTNIAKSKDK